MLFSVPLFMPPFLSRSILEPKTKHLLAQRDGGKALRDLERAAFRLTSEVVKLEHQLLKEWDNAVFMEQYIPAVTKEEMVYAQHACFAQNLAHVADGLEIVDWGQAQD